MWLLNSSCSNACFTREGAVPAVWSCLVPSLKGRVSDPNPIHFLSNSFNVSSRSASGPFCVCAENKSGDYTQPSSVNKLSGSARAIPANQQLGGVRACAQWRERGDGGTPAVGARVAVNLTGDGGSVCWCRVLVSSSSTVPRIADPMPQLIES